MQQNNNTTMGTCHYCKTAHPIVALSKDGYGKDYCSECAPTVRQWMNAKATRPLDIKDVYTVRFYAGVQCITNQQVEADTMDNAIAMALRTTVEVYDDGLTHVDAILSKDLKAQPAIARTEHDVIYIDLFNVFINDKQYCTK